MVKKAGLPDKAVLHILKTALGYPKAWLLPYLGDEVTCADFWLKHIEKMKLIIKVTNRGIRIVFLSIIHHCMFNKLTRASYCNWSDFCIGK